MEDFLKKKNIFNILLLGIMVLAVPITVKLARQQQILFSHAAETRIEFLTKDLGGTTNPDGSSCVISRNNKLVTLCKDVKVRLVAPTGADIKFQQAQSRTSFFPELGIVQKAYAGHCEVDEDHPENQEKRDNGTCSTGDYINDDGVTCHDKADGTHECDTPDAPAPPAPDAPAPPAPDAPAPPGEPAPAPPVGGPTGGPCGDRLGTQCPGYLQATSGQVQWYEPGKFIVDAANECVCGYGDNATKFCTPSGPIDPSPDSAWKFISGPLANGLTCDPGNPGTKGQKWSCGGTEKFSNDVSDSSCGGGPSYQCYQCQNGAYASTSGCANNFLPLCSNGLDGGQRCWAITQPPPGSTAYCTSTQNTCRDNPQAPPSGFKWTALCSAATCTTHSDCPVGVNNQPGWCYGFTDGAKCLKLESTGGGPECYVCDNGHYRYAGSDGALSGCPANATICNPANANTCKSPQDLRTQVCNTSVVPTPKYKCSSSGSCTRDDALGGFTTSNCDNSCIPGAKYKCLANACVRDASGTFDESSCGGTCQTSTLTCSAFSPNGLSDSGQVGPGGIKIYNTADFRGGRRLLNVTRSPATAAIGHPASTKNPATAPDLAFEAAADGSGNWIVNIPDNNSTTTDNDYTVSAAVSSGSATANCTPFIIHMPKKPAETVCPANITSTQVRMRAAASDNWSTGLSMNVGETIFVAGFHNNQTDTLAEEIILTATGPDGPQNRVVTLNSSAAPNNVSFAPTLPGRYTITVSKNGKTGPNCTGSVVLTVNVPPVVITAYRFAQNPTDLENQAFVAYPQGGAIVSVGFADTVVATPSSTPAPTPSPVAQVQGIVFAQAPANLGQKCVFVQFKDSLGNITERKNECINFVGPDPVISGSACNINVDIKDGSLQFKVLGNNFGNRDFSTSQLAADNSVLEIKEWTDQKVVARMANPPDTTNGKSYIVSLTRSDGIKVSSSCTVNTTQISLGAKLICRAPSNFDQDNVQLIIAQNTLGVGVTGVSGGNFQTGSKVKETVTITKEGVISNLKTKLQEGIEYVLCLKAPKSLRICSKPFTAVSGNNIFNKFELPVGDVNDDEAINSTDASICKSEWGPGKNKNCEFNRDNVTNSFEWSCLLHDFNKGNVAEP